MRHSCENPFSRNLKASDCIANKKMICGHFHTYQEILGRHVLRSDVNDATLDSEFCIFRMEIYSLLLLKEVD